MLVENTNLQVDDSWSDYIGRKSGGVLLDESVLPLLRCVGEHSQTQFVMCMCAMLCIYVSSDSLIV